MQFFRRALESLGTDTTFLVFADEVGRAKDLLAGLEHHGAGNGDGGGDGGEGGGARSGGGEGGEGKFKLVYVDENVVTSVKMMSLCQHHVLTSSTLSFWGAYLDRNQPEGGRTILDHTFFAAHGKGMVPYPSWEVFTDVQA